MTRQWARRVQTAFFAPGATEHDGNANGFVVALIGPRCIGDQCQAAEVVSNGKVLWELLAISKGPESTVDSFLDSFQPLG